MAAPPRTYRPVSEPARERETFRYNAPLLANFAFNFIDDGRPPTPTEVRPSSDRILTALAQLALAQTATERSLISLFDQTHQYVVAEATTSLTLGPDVKTDHGLDEDVGMCGIAVPRSLGVCEHVLCASDPIEFEKDDLAQGIPTIVVRDLTSDPRFMTKPYCQPGSPSRFYAAVPIRTYQGVNIGVLCVVSENTETVWTERHSQIMRNLSCTVMDHLEANRNCDARRRSERMNRGLGSFLEGRFSIASGRERHGENSFRDPPPSGPGLLRDSPRPLTRTGSEPPGTPMSTHRRDDSATPPRKRRRFASPRPDSACGMTSFPHVKEAGTPMTPNGRDTTPFDDGPPLQTGNDTFKRVFPLAANLIRESIEIEGCLFLAASLGPLPPPPPSLVVADSDNDEGAVSGGIDNSSGGEDDDDERWLSDESLTMPCQVLGKAGFHGTQTPAPHGVITKRDLARLLRRYPKGHIFNFDANGELQSNDSSEYDYTSAWKHWLGRTAAREDTDNHDSAGNGDEEEDTCNISSNNNGDTVKSIESSMNTANNSKPQPHDNKSCARHSLAASVIRTFPGARSVAFVPIWDARKERWCSGGFVYTCTPSRVLTVEDDLSFLRAFGMLAMSEVHRLETSLSEKTKSDALGSLSHELRSPLHGVVLGVELLNDTDLDVFQGNMVHMVETCCRTLADTIDHLLDFSKVNHFLQEEKRQTGGTKNLSDMRRAATAAAASASAAASAAPGKQVQTSASGRNLHRQVRLDALAEEVVDSVFAGFIFQRLSIQQLRRQGRSAKTAGPGPGADADAAAMHQLDVMQAVEEFRPRLSRDGTYQLRFRNVVISLAIEPAVSWTCHTSPGAVRRIVMNLFGNALKYTEQGHIKVEMRQAESTSAATRGAKRVRIRVTDTGRGIGEDYLQHKLFKPFSQEDHLSPGTGLGLSLVKQITTQLGGRISVRSRIGVGTAVSVSLPLTPEPPSLEPFDDADADFETHKRQLGGLCVRLAAFAQCQASQVEDVHLGPRCPARDVCTKWLHMKVAEEAGDGTMKKEETPDLVLCTEDELPESWHTDDGAMEPPWVVICANTLVAHQLASQFASRPRSRMVEFTFQPVGPRKLAKAFSVALKRWQNSASGETVSLPSQLPSAPSAPSTTTTTIPTKKGTAPRPPQPKPEPPSTEARGRTDFLLVEDNAVNMRILSTCMDKLGQTYDTAHNGQQAVDRYRANHARCRCILMDISMPVMDGFAATRLIRAFERDQQVAPPVTVIALTGLASEEAREEAAGCGIDLLLSKPVKLKELSSELASRGIIGGEGR